MTASETITNLGNAIISLANSKVSTHATSVESTLLDLKDTIDDIIEEGGGVIPTPTGTLSINQNGTYDVMNYASANVNVSGGGSNLQSKTFTVNSTTPTNVTIQPDSSYDGLSSVTLDLSYVENQLDDVLGTSSDIPIYSKYQLLQRITDDNNNEIGTVSGFFKDSNNVEYAVVCLDATYRNSSVSYAENNTTATSLPLYTNQEVYEENKTATENTTGILAAVSSTACSHCRSNSFSIGNTTYYGQLPNIIELIDIFKHRTAINNADTSGGSIVIPTSTVTWASTAYSVSSAWAINAGGRIVNTSSRASSYLCLPVLELPNSLY